MQESKTKTVAPRTFKALASQAKSRVKNGFWQEYQTEYEERMERAKEQGINEGKAARYFKEKLSARLFGEEEDEFYLKVKEILDREGFVSDIIGRLTEREVYEKLSYEQRQRYTFELSSKYLKAKERYIEEKQFE